MRSIRLAVLAFAAFLNSACDTARPVEGAPAVPHPTSFVDQHAAAALADLNSCKACHGADFSGGEVGVSCTSCHALVTGGFPDWQTNCTFCHGTRTPGWTATTASLLLVAPPRGTHGETLTSQAAVGAHQKHLGNGSAFSLGVACTECHTVPADLSHVNGMPATLTFGPLATQGGLAPAYAGGSCSATYCHGATLTGGANTTPSWTGSVACGDCHGLPPSSGGHQWTNHAALHCGNCHAQVAPDTAQPGIFDPGLHVNGVKNVDFGGSFGGNAVIGTWDGTAKTCSSVSCHTLAPSLRYW